MFQFFPFIFIAAVILSPSCTESKTESPATDETSSAIGSSGGSYSNTALGAGISVPENAFNTAVEVEIEEANASDFGEADAASNAVQISMKDSEGNDISEDDLSGNFSVDLFLNETGLTLADVVVLMLEDATVYSIDSSLLSIRDEDDFTIVTVELDKPNVALMVVLASSVSGNSYESYPESSSGAGLSAVSFGSMSLGASCDISVPVTITKSADSATLESYEASFDGSSAAITYGSVNSSVATEFSLDLDISGIDSAGSFDFAFSASGGNENTVNSSTSITISSAPVSLASPTFPDSPTVDNIPGDGFLALQSSDSACLDCSGAATSIVGGRYFGCAIVEGDKVKCWGDNGSGQLGDGQTTDQPNPVYVLTSGTDQLDTGTHLSDVKALAAGDDSACVILDTSEVMCWGNNTNRQLGNGTSAGPALNPTYVLLVGSDQANDRLTGAISIAIADSRACAVLDNGNVMCWGAEGNGGLGNGVTSGFEDNPVFVLTQGSDQANFRLTNAVSMSSGSYNVSHFCVVLDTTEVMCWGGQDNGELGYEPDGSFPIDTNASNAVYVLTSGTDQSANRLSGAVYVTTGGGHSCALMDNGEVMCWGLGDQRGDGTGSDSPYPTYVLKSGTDQNVDRLSNVISLSSDYQHACAVESDGYTYCWGHQDDYRLGNGLSPSSYVLNPVQVLATGNTQGVDRLTGGKMVATLGFATCLLMNSGEQMCWGRGNWGMLGDGDTSTHDATNPIFTLSIGTDQANDRFLPDSGSCNQLTLP